MAILFLVGHTFYGLLLIFSQVFVKFLRGILGGGDVSYILKRNLMPKGLCCGQMLPAIPLSEHVTP